jgi:hypothetical protein
MNVSRQNIVKREIFDFSLVGTRRRQGSFAKLSARSRIAAKHRHRTKQKLPQFGKFDVVPDIAETKWLVEVKL